MSHGMVELGRQCGFFETLAPTTSTGITAAILNPAKIRGVAQAGAATSITLASGASAVTSYYVGWTVKIYAGTGKDQQRTITAYNGSTKVATVATWETNPDSSSNYALVPPFDGLEAQEALLIVETNPIRFRMDGIAPTATVGALVNQGSSITIKGAVNLKNFRCIDTASGASSVAVHVLF